MIEKQQFKNESGGFLGAVVIGPKGDETGVGVPPDGTVWLSKQEQVLTANAPRRPEDNPFTEQSRTVINPETGEAETETFTPLVPVHGERYVPSQGRFVPGLAGDLSTPAQAHAAAQAAATGPDPVTVNADAPTAESAHAQAPPVPPRAAAAASASVDDADPVARESAPLPPSPIGSTPPTPEPQEPPQTPQEAPVETEEHAAAVDPAVGEETGAATPPQGDAPQGEFQAGEEVGTPVPTSAPAPFTPPPAAE